MIYFCKFPLDPTKPNDGLLHVEDQILEGFGTDLGILDCDHIDLVIGTSHSFDNSDIAEVKLTAVIPFRYKYAPTKTRN